MGHPIPLNEAARLEALESLRVLDTPPDPFFDAAVDLVRRLMKTPVALFGLIDAERHWFKARLGTDLCENRRDASICTFALMSDEAMVVPDTLEDARTATCPIVVGGPKVRYYVGAPLVLSDGYRVGTLCAIDFQPRPRPSEEDVATLRSIAAMTVHEMERRRAGPPPREAAEAAKSVFLSLVGHELKTPLNGVLGFGRIVASSSSDPMARDFSGHIVQSAGHLEGLVDRVIALSRAEAGELRLREERVDLPSLVEEAVAVAAAVSGRPEPRIDRDLSAAPPTLVGDAAQIRQMVVNLVVNALVHGAGTVTIAAGTAEDGGVALAVSDEGAGLSEDLMAAALAPFEIGEDHLRRRGEGLGLGLPLTRRLAQLHGGELELSRAPSGGLRARLSLPGWRSGPKAETLLGAG